MNEPSTELVEKIHVLIESLGQRQKLKQFITRRLDESGWCDVVKIQCSKYIEATVDSLKVPPQSIPIEDIVQNVMKMCIELIPKDLKKEVLLKMLSILADQDM